MTRKLRKLPRKPSLGQRGQHDLESELDKELEFHFRERVDALTQEGWSLEDAEEEAARRFGDLERYRRRLLRIDQRRRIKASAGTALRVVEGALSWALRGLWKRPGFSGGIIATIALGIGANALVYGVVDRLFLSPPQHVVDPDEVRLLWLERHEPSGPFAWRRFTYPDYVSLHQVRSFEQLAAYGDRDEVPVGMGEDLQQASVVRATASLFPLLGAVPLAGRFFSVEDDARGAPRTVVLSEEYWDRRFGRDPSILGTLLSIGGSQGPTSYEVIGIAPAGFTGAELDRTDLWVPIHPDLRGVDRWQDWTLHIVARLKEGAAPGDADRLATDVHRVARTAWAEAEGNAGYDPDARVFSSSLIAARGPQPSSTATVSGWLAVVSFIVLLLACTNVANLLLANNIRTRQEMDIKAFLGASPGLITWQLLGRNVFLTGLGGLVGVGVWFALSPVFHRALMPSVEYSTSIAMPRVMVFAAAATLLTGLGTGLLPALQSRRMTSLSSLRSGTRWSSSSSARSRGGLLAGQTALSVVLLIGAGLFIFSLRRARAFDLGFSPAEVGEVKLEFAGGVTRSRRTTLYQQAVEMIEALPSVRSAALFTGSRPLEGGMNRQLRVPSLAALPQMPGGMPRLYRGSTKYPEVFGLRVIQGRAPTREDVLPGSEPVILVSETTGRTLWPETGPLNQCIHVEGDRTPDGPSEPCRRVVGIFADVVNYSLDEPPAFAVFVPEPEGAAMGTVPWGLAFRANGSLMAVLGDVRRAVRDVSPEIYFADVQAASTNLDQKLRPWTLGARLFTGLGFLGLVIACVGLYSALVFDVAQRRRELGIRAAMGASPRGLVVLVLKRTGSFVLGGLLFGIAIAMATGRFLEAILFETSATEPGVYALVAATMMLTGLFAAVIPSYRAAASDPMEVIAAE